MAASDSLECLVKEPVLTHQLWAALKGFHHKGPGPILVLTVHSSPVPLCLSWDGTPSWPPVVSWELNPQVLGTVKEGPRSGSVLPAALQDKQRAIISKSLVSLLRVV